MGARDGMLQALVGDLDGSYAGFVRVHADAVYSAALRLSRSPADADDIAQETFVRAYRALRRYDADRVRALEARPWLLTITLNLWRNSLRSAARRPRTSPTRQADVAGADPRPGPEEMAMTAEASRALGDLLGLLPEHHRVPVILRHVVGLSYSEMASALGCPVGTVKANVARGLAALREVAATGGAVAASSPGRAVTPPPRPRPRSTAAGAAGTTPSPRARPVATPGPRRRPVVPLGVTSPSRARSRTAPPKETP